MYFAVNGRIRINDLLKEASEKYSHIGRVDIEKRRFHHRLQVVQKIEDTQRSNVVRSVGDVIRHGLDPDEVNAIYAFVKNAQLQRLQVGVATVAASIYTFSQNKKEDEDATVWSIKTGFFWTFFRTLNQLELAKP